MLAIIYSLLHFVVTLIRLLGDIALIIICVHLIGYKTAWNIFFWTVIGFIILVFILAALHPVYD